MEHAMAFIGIGVTMAIVGYVVGLIAERTRWNGLMEHYMQAGMIPRPKTRAGRPYPQ